MEKTTEQMKIESEEFFKLAFCIDGEAKMIKPDGFKINAVIKLEDSKRGTFYIAQVSPK